MIVRINETHCLSLNFVGAVHMQYYKVVELMKHAQ